MKFHFIEKGTLITVEPTEQGEDNQLKYVGLFQENKGDSLYMKGDELCTYCKTVLAEAEGKDVFLRFNFYHGPNNCEFRGKIEQVFTVYDEPQIEITPSSAIITKNRRSAYRHRLLTDITLHLYIDGVMDSYAGETEDISTNSIRFTSGIDIDIKSGNNITLEFILFDKHHFNLPAKLLTKIKSSANTKNNCVFIFDFSECKDESKRLLDSFFEHSIEVRKFHKAETKPRHESMIH